MDTFYERILDNFLEENNIKYNSSTKEILYQLGFEVQEMDIKLNNVFGLMIVSDKLDYINGYFSNKVIVINKNIKEEVIKELLNYFLGLYILKRNDKKTDLEFVSKIYDDSFRNKSAEKIFEIYKEKGNN